MGRSAVRLVRAARLALSGMRLRVGTTAADEPVLVDTAKVRRLLVVSDPGAGATTLARFVTRWWIADPARRCAVYTGRPHEFADMASAGPPAAVAPEPAAAGLVGPAPTQLASSIAGRGDEDGLAPALTLGVSGVGNALGAGQVLVNPPGPPPGGREWMFVLDEQRGGTTATGRRRVDGVLAALAHATAGPGFGLVTAAGGEGQQLVESAQWFDMCLGLHPRTAARWVVEQGRLDWPLEAVAVRADDRGQADTLPHKWQCRRRKAG